MCWEKKDCIIYKADEQKNKKKNYSLESNSVYLTVDLVPRFTYHCPAEVESSAGTFELSVPASRSDETAKYSVDWRIAQDAEAGGRRVGPQRDARGRSLEGTDIDFLPLFLIRSSVKAMEKGGDDVRSSARFDTSRLTVRQKKKEKKEKKTQPVIKSAPGILSTILDRAAHRIIDIFGPFANRLRADLRPFRASHRVAKIRRVIRGV